MTKTDTNGLDIEKGQLSLPLGSKEGDGGEDGEEPQHSKPTFPTPAAIKQRDFALHSHVLADLPRNSAPDLHEEGVRRRLGGRLGVVRSQSLPGMRRNASSAVKASPIPKQVPLFQGVLTPAIPLRPPPTWKRQLVNVVRYSFLNILLVMIPVSWALHFSHQSDTAIFITSGLAIIPLAGLLGFATEEIALRVGDTFGALLNCTFGNTVELIIAILALIKGELRIVQSAMIGSILSNCLLVLGMCFWFGGLRFHEQGYTVRAAQLQINMLGLSVLAIVIPAAFSTSLDMNAGGTTDLSVGEAAGQTAETELSNLLKISRGSAIMLLVVYVAYLFFQLWTHAYLYRRPASETGGLTSPMLAAVGDPQPPSDRVFRLPESWHSRSSSSSGSSASSVKSDDDDEGQPKLLLLASIGLLVVVTVFTGVTAEFLVSSINGLTATGNISKEFVALILLPLIGNAAEHATAVVVAVKNKVDLAMGVAVGSSIQIALFVIPLLICIAWAAGKPLTLYFDVLETLVLFLAVVLVNWAIQDGRTNWLEGFVLVIVYGIIALTFWFYPGSPEITAMMARK